MILFLIKSTICLALLYTFYKVLLEATKMHHFNRFYLLSIIALSLVIPNITLFIEHSLLANISELNAVTSKALFYQNIVSILKIIYSIGIAVLSLRFLRNLIVVLKNIVTNEKLSFNNYNLILVKDKVLPHSFFNFIFINREDYKEGKVNDELLTHERSHVKGWHTIDVLLVEVFYIVFWFNPLALLIKKAVKLNHEYIADQDVIHTHKNKAFYQNLLLSVATWNNQINLSSNLNYALTKKRFEMMAKGRCKKNIRLTKIILAPFILIIFLLFSNNSAPIKRNLEHNSFWSNPTHTYFTDHANSYEHDGSELTERSHSENDSHR